MVKSHSHLESYDWDVGRLVNLPRVLYELALHSGFAQEPPLSSS